MSANLSPAQQAIVDAYVVAERAFRADPTPAAHADLVRATAASRSAFLLADSVEACGDARAKESPSQRKRQRVPTSKAAPPPEQEAIAPVLIETPTPLALF